MTKSEFKQKLDKIYSPDDRGFVDCEKSHDAADDLLVETLESLGYDLTVFKNADNWYG